MSKNPENKTGLGFDKFKIVTGINNTSSGKPKRGMTYEIVAGDKTALRASSSHGRDWFIVTTPILRAHVADGSVVPVK